MAPPPPPPASELRSPLLADAQDASPSTSTPASSQHRTPAPPHNAWLMGLHSPVLAWEPQLVPTASYGLGLLRLHHYDDGDAPDGAPFRFSWKKLYAFAGPGFIMCAAFFDPGNLEGDLQIGSQAGYALLWVLVWATVVGALFQVLASRIGVVSGADVAQLMRRSLRPPLRVALWLVIESAIIGSDIQEVLGCAIAISVLSNGAIPLWAGTLLTATDSFAFLFLEEAGVRYLELFFAALVGVIGVAFGGMAVEAAPDPAALLQGTLVPQLSAAHVPAALGLLGAVVMPHNLFLHSSLVMTRDVDRTSQARIKEAIVYFTIEACVTLTLSLLINMMVVAVAAQAFIGGGGGGAGGSPEREVGLSTAADFLTLHYPRYIRYVWAVGLLAAGQSSTMSGTYAGQFVMQGFLDLQVTPWQRVVFTRVAALGPALLVAVSTTAGAQMDGTSDVLNILQSLQLPFAAMPVLVLGHSRRLMGPHATSTATAAVGVALVAALVACNGYLMVHAGARWVASSWAKTAVTAVGATAYVALLAAVTRALLRHWSEGDPTPSHNASLPLDDPQIAIENDVD